MSSNGSILLHDTPSDWNVKKIKYVFDERKEVNDPVKTDVLVSLTHDRGVILHLNKGGIGNKPKNELTKYKLVYPGDIVVNSMNVTIGSSGLSDYYGLVSPVYYMLTTKEPGYKKRFFHYLFRSLVFQKSLIGLGNGILEHRMRIPMEKLGGELIPLPPPKEQKRIACYLDKKTGQIDSLIEKIEKKIELLKEQRTALISQCVTKGLDPTVEMKDSGVEWIGEIPKGWEVARMAVMGRFSKGKNITKDELVEYGEPVILYGHIYTTFERVATDIKFFISRQKSLESTKICRNQFLFTSSGESVEDIGKSILYKGEEPVNVGGDALIFTLNDPEQIDPDFLSFLLNSKGCQDQKSSMSRGEIVVHIYEKQIREIRLTLPPLSEQVEIRKFLSENEKNTRDMNFRLRQKIALLKEYRSSLISSAVTGKVRVTEDML